jgi:hypothetical protein
MKQFKYIIYLLITSASIACHHKQETNFGLFSMVLPNECSIRFIKHDLNNTSAILYYKNDSLGLSFHTDSLESKEPKDYGYDSPQSISPYDIYNADTWDTLEVFQFVSPTKKNTNEYTKTYTEYDGQMARIINATSNKKKYIEIFFKDICHKTSILFISGDRVSPETADMIVEVTKTIKFNCK